MCKGKPISDESCKVAYELGPVFMFDIYDVVENNMTKKIHLWCYCFTFIFFSFFSVELGRFSSYLTL